MIKKGFIEVDDRVLPVLSVEVIPSEFSSPENMRFEWSVSEMTKRYIRLQLNFETAKFISANAEADRIRITFNDRFMFISEDDLAIQPPKNNQGIPLYATRRMQGAFDQDKEDYFVYLERELPT